MNFWKCSVTVCFTKFGLTFYLKCSKKQKVTKKVWGWSWMKSQPWTNFSSQLTQIRVWQVKVLMIDWTRPWSKLCIIIHTCYFWLAWFVLDLWLRKQFEIISVLVHWQWWMNWILLMPNIGLDRKQIALATVVFCYEISEDGK